jgi:hypothetical protein
MLADFWYGDLFDLDVEIRAFVFLFGPVVNLSCATEAKRTSLTTTAPQHSVGMS